MSVPARHLSYEASSYSSLNQRPHKAAQKSSKSFKCLTMSTVNLGRTYLDTHTLCAVGEEEGEVEGGSSGAATSFIMSSFMAQCATGFFLLSYAPTPKKTPETRRPQVGGAVREVVGFEYYRNTAAQ